MELEAILKLYDAYQRLDLRVHGMRREVDGMVVRHVSLHETRSYVVYAQLTPENADEVIRRQREYFCQMKASFEWAAYAHDGPSNLRERLVAQGFEPEESEAIVVLELDAIGPSLSGPVVVDVRRIREVAELVDVAVSKLQDEEWEASDFEVNQRLSRELQEIPDRLSIYVAYCDGVPVSSGWLRFDPESPFASLWGGSTRPEYRNRGFYTAVVAARAQEAKERGARFLTVDAQSMSRPILKKLGFKVLTWATPMLWQASA